MRKVLHSYYHEVININAEPMEFAYFGVICFITNMLAQKRPVAHTQCKGTKFVTKFLMHLQLSLGSWTIVPAFSDRSVLIIMLK